MMDKKLIEKYLMMYPKIDEIIKSLEDDLKFYEFRKTEYELSNQHKNRNDLIDRIDGGLKQKHDEILELINIKEYISMTLRRADTNCRKIVDLRLWKKKCWDEISGEIGTSTRQAERTYKQFFEYFKNFNPKIWPDDIQ